MIEEIQKNIPELISTIKANYAAWLTRGEADVPAHRLEMIAEFNAGMSYSVGRKYIKILSKGSVWGFIQIEDDAKFRAGDILKAASWAMPARNKPRGNVIDGGYKIQWMGPNYL
jgi:hypothetical protein